MEDPSQTSPTDGQAFPWILEHLLAYPGSYEIPLRTMYTLNSTSQNQQRNPQAQPEMPGNAFSRQKTTPNDEQPHSTASAAAHLRANLMTHISQLPSQPTSLPPAFITSFVRQTFGPELGDVDFLQALTAMDYLRDLDIRRRREVLSALDKLGVDRSDLGQKDKLIKKYPGVLRWIVDIELKERKVETLYTQIYIGLRRWTILNELSLEPFNKSNCIAMLNTLYPPPMPGSTETPTPTAQLTPQILSTQRNGFFRYITGVERGGKAILKSLYEQNKKPGDANGWASLRENLDNYLRMTIGIIDECYEITGASPKPSPTAASFASVAASGYSDDESRRKVDSGISFATSNSSNRNSGGSSSHATRPSTSSSVSTHSRNTSSNNKQLPEKPLPIPVEDHDEKHTTTDNEPTPVKPAGTKLERLARELRKMRSRSNVRGQSKPRPQTAVVVEDESMADAPPLPAQSQPQSQPQPQPQLPSSQPPATPGKDRTLRFKRSFKNMRSGSSGGALRERDGNSRPSTSGVDEVQSPATAGGGKGGAVPVFDVEEMKARRLEWEQKSRQNSAQSEEFC